MEEIIVAPIIIFMLVVAPIWLILHYRSKRQISQGLTEEEYNQLSDLSEMADKMADRIKTLEDARSMRYNGIAKTIKSVIKKNQDKTVLSIYDKYKNDLMNPKKKKMPIILESIIQTELSYVISMIDNISTKPTEVIKNKLIPVISEVKNQLAKVKDIYDRLVKEGVISKDKPEPNTAT